MEKKPTGAQPEEQLFAVRAMPAPGHTHRRRIGRAWGKEQTIVRVVDSPTPPRTEIDRDKKKVVILSDEISAAELATLQNDPHIAVMPYRAKNAADSMEVAKLKAELAKMAGELADARREQQDAIEELKMHGETSRKDAEEAGARIAGLEADLSKARAAFKTKSEKAAEKSSEPKAG